MWTDVISVDESEMLCRIWRSQGHTSAAELRALLEVRADRLRWFRSVREKWGTGKGRVA